MDWKGAGLAVAAATVLAGSAAGQTQTSKKIELVCNGTFSFLNASTSRLDDMKSDGVFVRIEKNVIHLVGGVASLNDAYFAIDRNNESEVTFWDAAGAGGVLNRHSGHLTVHRQNPTTKKVDYIYEAVCGLPRPLF